MLPQAKQTIAKFKMGKISSDWLFKTNTFLYNSIHMHIKCNIRDQSLIVK